MNGKAPVDLPDPVCEIHDNPKYPCPDCERASKIEDRVLFVVPFVLLVAVGIYLWLSRQ